MFIQWRAVVMAGKKASARPRTPAKTASGADGASSPRKKASGAATRVRKPVAEAVSTASPRHASGRDVAASTAADAPVAHRKNTRSLRLGRARIPADSHLESLFPTDAEARRVFEFLGVNTIRELEQFGPEEIARRLTGSMLETINRIRHALALSNRCLDGDVEFAVNLLATVAAQPGKARTKSGRKTAKK